MRFVRGLEISIEALEKSRSRAVPKISGDIEFRSIASGDNKALGEPWHSLQPRQSFGQSRFRNRESLAHVHCRCLMVKAKTPYAHLTPAFCPHLNGTAIRNSKPLRKCSAIVSCVALHSESLTERYCRFSVFTKGIYIII